MDLRQFVKQTVQDIVEATVELQQDLEGKGVIVNPPLSSDGNITYEHEDADHIRRRIEVIDFDVAVTVGAETAGGGRAGLKVWSVEAGGDGRHARRSEEVSRVRFSLPIVYSPAAVEARNKEAARKRAERNQEALATRRGRPS
jgi:hypothetical protein